jgi:hypothetical protein
MSAGSVVVAQVALPISSTLLNVLGEFLSDTSVEAEPTTSLGDWTKPGVAFAEYHIDEE